MLQIARFRGDDKIESHVGFSSGVSLDLRSLQGRNLLSFEYVSPQLEDETYT